MAGPRLQRPVAVALVATALAGLVTALVLSFVLDDDPGDGAEPALLTLPGEGTAPQVDLRGEPAPDFTYERLTAEGEGDFSELRAGRPAIVNFFAEWCAPCVEEMPDLEAAFQEYGDEITFLGLSYRESVEDGRALVARTGVTFETGRDPGSDILTAYSGQGMPTTVFVTAGGTITTVHTGPISPTELRAELDALLV